MRKNGSSQDRDFILFGARIVGDFGVTIAVPVVLFAWAGKTLDERWGTAPWLLILGFAAAAAVSGLSIYRKARTYSREYQRLIDRQDAAARAREERSPDQKEGS